MNHKKLKFKSDILKSSNKFIFYKYFYNCFYIFLFIYIKMPKVLSAKYYQENKKKATKKACERYQDLSNNEKEKKVAIWSWALQKSLRK